MGIVLIGLMFGLIAIGVPITFALGIACLVFFSVGDMSIVTFVQKFVTSVDSFTLVSLPFFILAGNLMNTGGVTKRLFSFAQDALGAVRGSLCYVGIMASMIFSAISGSAIANAAGLGSIQIKAMEEQGYDKEFSAGLVSAAAILGPIIPPSVIMIVYAVTAGVSVNKMFTAGIIPGCVYGLMLALLCRYYGKKYDFPRGKKFNFKSFLSSFKEAIWALLAPVIILGGIFSGMFTATESGAIATVYVIFVGLFVYKDLKVKDLFPIFLESAKTTGTVFMIAATAAILGFCLTYAQLPQQLANFFAGVIDNKVVLMAVFAVIYLFLGCIMEASAIVLTTVPIFMHLCTAMGIDPIYFGVFTCIIMSIGTITPPVGTAMFVVCRNTGISIERFTKIILPWYALILVFLLLLVLFPGIITFLPNFLG